MQALMCGLAALRTVAAASARWAADVYLVDITKGKRPMVTEKDGFTRSLVPITNRGKNQNYSSAMMIATSVSADRRRSHKAPILNREIPGAKTAD